MERGLEAHTVPQPDSIDIDSAVSNASGILNAYHAGTITAEDTAKLISLVWRAARRAIRDK